MLFRIFAALGAIATSIHRIATANRRIEQRLARVIDLQEALMGDFTALNAKLDEQDAARVAATDRIAEDVQALNDKIAELELATNDQAEIDAITQRIQGNVDALNAIDPVKVDESGAPTTEPTEPTEPATPGEEPSEPTDG